MTRKIAPSLVLALAASGALAAPTAAAPQDQEKGKAVMVCAQDGLTARSYERTYGERPTFMTARQVLETGESWSAPRCMTEREYAQLVRVTEERARAR